MTMSKYYAEDLIKLLTSQAKKSWYHEARMHVENINVPGDRTSLKCIHKHGANRYYLDDQFYSKYRITELLYKNFKATV